jgi:hypothetical protein
MAKKKLLNLALIVTSLFGYLEWAGENAAFLFEMELEILGKLFQDPMSVVHPFVLIPLFGQLLLLITLFQRVPSRWLTVLGLGSLGLLLGLMLFIGLMEAHFKILASTLPFWILAVMAIREHWKSPLSAAV